MESIQNLYKIEVKGAECSVLGCRNILGIDDSSIVMEHILPQGEYKHLALDRNNMAPTCGCQNLDNHKPFQKRLEAIKRYLPKYYAYAITMSETKWKRLDV